jgi:hypothetical protein
MSCVRPIWPSCLAFFSFCAVGSSVFSPDIAHLLRVSR